MASILVVDDYRDTADTTAVWLKQLGHEVHIARDGVEAIEIARRQQPRCILLDLGLPRLDGYQVAARLRQEQAGPLVIIAITGYGQEMHRRQALEAGCDHFFLKPIDLSVLSSLLSDLNGAPDSSIRDGRQSETKPPPGPAARREVEIVNMLGLHLRAADKFVSLAREFQATVAVIHDGRQVSGSSILDLTSLAVECGSRIVLRAEGPDALAAVDALTNLVVRRFDEE